MEEKKINQKEKEENKENKTATCECQEKQDKHGNKKCSKKQDEKIKQLEEEKNNLFEKLQYAQAELINYRKRKDDEMSLAMKYANQDIITEMLSVLDNFERAISLDDNNLTDELSKFLTGFKMIYATLKETLKQYGVEEIEAFQKPFDPTCMEALMTDHDQAFENGIVLEVLLKGYKLKDRVIRPCSVKVNQLEGEDKNE